MKTIKIHQEDNVIVALQNLEKDEIHQEITVLDKINTGHKIANRNIGQGEIIIKYGLPIGIATKDIKQGEWVHTHNIKTRLEEEATYTYNHKKSALQKTEPKTFMGYERKDGRAGIRNEIWIIPTVGCVNGVVTKLAQDNNHIVKENIEGLYAYPHPFGCSQMGEDDQNTRRVLASLVNHPNAGAVLVVGLGCENNTIKLFKEALGKWDDDRVKFLMCQESEDEIKEGSELLSQLAEYANQFKRTQISTEKLVIGMKCGGSDGLSGITANSAVGKFSDLLISTGGSTILTEVPEMFGAENLLMDKCINEEIFNKAVDMINGFKDYFVSHGQVVYENPSPGNKEGGISTLEDKSCGCVQKGGSADIVDVIGYGEQVKKQGLTLLNGPGNDLVSSTALAAAGAHLVLFTTGRGTPFGSAVPTIKISSNTSLFEKHSKWIDFNAGTIADNVETIDESGERLLEFVLEVASGKHTKTEISGYREISIFKGGVVL
ncbi:altronate hydrolase [Candidatus Epulonipiscium fishelsonii]|uniref:Altronate hydrolase n=1 Tax=Candidatus Epulonipiscium fishelsonii TaxID=77094 RepID=A0ACC8XBU7_9FIRM|nr:altronate hydrolase [Epulopiscium sp. SCG-B05WGA-EpuloA1]ONI39777.1 altronate hydrolase [Epulopiscium sp. SCG-B11WGA-EpuloA1]